MSNGRSNRGMGRYLQGSAPVEGADDNSKNPGVALTESAVRDAEQRAKRFESAKGLSYSGPRRGMGYYLERGE
ncbi:hypothetical protein [Rhodococcus sp. ACT016]|uniref:hypothetical protein n=1 Tax=Rhodococcus sp. ACT016 TaxID=3134808 RepID=UPI003D2DFCD0